LSFDDDDANLYIYESYDLARPQKKKSKTKEQKRKGNDSVTQKITH
jgi:hypothetical protein